MGPCALRAPGAASTVRMVLQRKGETVCVCVVFHPVGSFKKNCDPSSSQMRLILRAWMYEVAGVMRNAGPMMQIAA